jgi:hypothetical protein
MSPWALPGPRKRTTALLGTEYRYLNRALGANSIYFYKNSLKVKNYFSKVEKIYNLGYSTLNS